MLSTFSIIVKGNVQGVFFRQSTKEKALALGLKGQVSNQPDGSVHILATGTKEQLDELAKWCHEGPARATVTGVEVQSIPVQNFNTFIIHRN